MRKTITYGFRTLKLAIQANGIYAILSVISKLYESTFYPFFQVILLAKLLDIIQQSAQLTFPQVSQIIAAYIILTVIKISLTTFLDVKQAYLDAEFETYIDILVAQKLTQIDPATFENAKFQDLIAQLEGVKGSLQAHLIRFIAIVDQIFKFITAAVVVSAMFPTFAPIILVATIPTYLAWDNFRKKTWEYYVEKRSKLTRISQYIKKLLSEDSTSKETAIFQTGDTLIHKITKHRSKYFKQFQKTNDPWIFYVIIARIIQFSAFFFTQYLNLAKVISNSLSIGSFTLVFQQSLTLTFSSEEILNQYSSISTRNKYLDKFFTFLSTPPTISLPKTPQLIPPSPKPPTIQFKNVTFSYPNTKRPILHNFNLTIKPGEKIALVGENGAGKTTLIKLLLRFFDATSGEILINGVNIKQLDLPGWHSQIGALFQDFIKYQFTLKENIYFGKLDKKTSKSDLEKAINQSGADQYLHKLPRGINQIVGKLFHGGIDLSGGQWQKLALARAFYRDAPILILDEPTSAIDAKAEFEIFQRVQNLQQDKTVIIISHRFSTVRNADRILVLDQGKIIEQGTHTKLMEQKGLYAELFQIQAQGYQ